MRYDERDLTTRQMLESMRRATERAYNRRYLNEDENEKFNDYDEKRDKNNDDAYTNGDGYTPITNDIKFGQNTLDTVKNDFVHSINANVKFPKNCLQYSTEKRDVVFVGTILDLNNLHFKFCFNDNSGCGCYIWNEYSGGNNDELAVSSDNGGESGRLQLTDENLKKVSLIAAAYKNWKNYWLENASLIFS